ncbi:uncharacterized protein LOC106762504 [Vigna radiata var. radiata]|uniref:Ribokinase n=1 Tax=Vigna radiata var. radiata TaxID=3916 RepID=A0A1S3U7H0_VIGRR|nr:uncharacterized protein LOC106762504 [Vigna radiata var. radiata]XP_014501951.1 uncharacterized protein LOC106762504 [Vigna radiata var. radiata]
MRSVTATLSTQQHCFHYHTQTTFLTTTLIPIQSLSFRTPNHNFRLLCFSSNPSPPPPPLVVVGSANADIYVEIDRLPREGETLAARSGQTLAGGKGANQATCSAKLNYPTYFVGQVGDDAYGSLVTDALRSGGVRLDGLTVVPSASTGQAVVMLQSNGQNSIIYIGGANLSWHRFLPRQHLDLVAQAGIVLLQREIPDFVNTQVAQAARNAGVPVVLDAGGMDGPLAPELLNFVDILSPNETELGRLTGMPTESFEEIARAALKCHQLGAKKVLAKLGHKGSALFVEGENPIQQPAILSKTVIDTTGAGDTFTSAFAVALVEGKSYRECLRFAAAAACLCVQVKGASPSMPDRISVMDLLNCQ